MQELRLTPTSYIVLGLIDWFGESTPYRLKQAVAGSIGHFWTLHHAQLYSETERLARAGYLSERRENGGRRRKAYALTDSGRAAFAEWRDEPTDHIAELRDLALLKLFFGADRRELARGQIEAHEAKLAAYEEIRDTMPDDVPEGPRLVLEAGIGGERAAIAYWRGLAD